MGKYSRQLQLASNLPQLQNLAKRDAESYKDECAQQYQHYLSVLEVFKLKPSQQNKEFNSLVAFICQVSHCYPKLFKDFASQLMDLLKKSYTLMDPETRMVLCKSLVMLRRKNLIMPTCLLEFFFQLLSCQDKALRKMLFTYIVTDIKRINAKHKDVKLNTTLQNFMFSMLAHHNATAAKLSLDAMMALYHKNVWNNAKTVNVITTAFSKVTKIMVAALTFFNGKDEDSKDDKDSDNSSDSEPEQKSARDLQLSHRVGKKSKKRKKQLQRAMSVLKRNKKKHKAPAVNFSALHLIHDPQGFAEKLFKQLETTNERFEVKLMMMNLISRLIGLHQLIVINFYPLLQRFLQPHQRDVTHILLYAAQSCHELVPPDIIQPVLYTVANNFVTERNSSECMAVGINTIREMCSRSVTTMIPQDLLHDLTQYKSYRDKNVAVAARSLITLYRINNPALLQRKDKGKPTEYSRSELTVTEFGESKAQAYIPGAEILPDRNNDDDWCSASDESDDDGGDDSDAWVDVSDDDADHIDDSVQTQQTPALVSEEDKVAKCSQISTNRFITQDEFKQIRMSQMRKQLEASKPKSGGKRKSVDDHIEMDDSDDNESPDLVKLSTITHLAKKRKMEKEEKIARSREGKSDKQKFGHRQKKHQVKKGNTNKEKKKNKAFMMLRPKLKAKTSKRSFRDKQIALRNSLLKQQRKFK